MCEAPVPDESRSDRRTRSSDRHLPPASHWNNRIRHLLSYVLRPCGSLGRPVEELQAWELRWTDDSRQSKVLHCQELSRARTPQRFAPSRARCVCRTAMIDRLLFRNHVYTVANATYRIRDMCAPGRIERGSMTEDTTTVRTANATSKLGLPAMTAMVVGSMVGAGVFQLPSRFASETGVYGGGDLLGDCRHRNAHPRVRISESCEAQTESGQRRVRLRPRGIRRLPRVPFRSWLLGFRMRRKCILLGADHDHRVAAVPGSRTGSGFRRHLVGVRGVGSRGVGVLLPHPQRCEGSCMDQHDCHRREIGSAAAVPGSRDLLLRSRRLRGQSDRRVRPSRRGTPCFSRCKAPC